MDVTIRAVSINVKIVEEDRRRPFARIVIEQEDGGESEIWIFSKDIQILRDAFKEAQ